MCQSWLFVRNVISNISTPVVYITNTFLFQMNFGYLLKKVNFFLMQ